MNAPLQTILIVEDDPDIRRLVGELLGREGFAVEAAEDAAAMDAVLNGESGADTARPGT